MCPTHSTDGADEILAQLLVLGKKSKEPAFLEKFLEDLQWDTLNDALSWLFDKRNKRGATFAPDAVHYLYRGLASEAQREKRTQSTLAILHYLREADHLSRAIRNDTVDRLALALDSASGGELVAAAQDLVGSLRRRDDPHSTWRTALPKILALVNECQQVPHDGDFITGADFRSEIMTTLLELEWSAESLASLAIMFSDMSPSPETLLALAEKFCATLPGLAPPALAALAQSLLPLLRNHGAPTLFFALARYFDKWVYAAPSTQSLSQEDRRWLKDAPAAEATLRLCVLDSANAGGLRGFLRSASKMAASPELLLSPFLLATLLALSQLPTYQEPCLKVVAAAVVRATEEQRLRSASAWIRSVTSAPCQPQLTFTQVVEHNHESERVLRGLVALSLRLLDMPRRGSAQLGSAVCAVASSALVAVVRRRPREMAPHVLAELFDHSRSNAEATQFVDCVAAVVSACPDSVALSGNATRAALSSIGCHALGPELVRALAPALAPSAPGGDASALRETLIIVLRKDLASNKLETRLNAVSSLLHLLRRLAVKDLVAISSSQCSQLMPSTSRLSQAKSSQSQRGFSPSEATCTDLLRALARCFGQQASVRQALYRGLGRSASRNPELIGYVHDMLLGQLSIYLGPAEEETPLIFGECIDSSGALKEPLGHLLLACAQALAQGCDNAGSGKRLRATLDTLVVSMPKYHPDDIVQGVDWDRELLVQAQDCLDALLVHVVLSDSKTGGNVTTETADKMAALVQAHERCLDFAKPVAGGKGAKGAKGSRARKAKAAQGTQLEDEIKKTKPRTTGSKPRAAVFDHNATLRLLEEAFRDGSDLEPLRRVALRHCSAAAAEPDNDCSAFTASAAAALWVFVCRGAADQSTAFAPALKLIVDLTALMINRWPNKLQDFLHSVGGGLEAMLASLRHLIEGDLEGDDELALVNALAALAEYADPAQAHLVELLSWLESRLTSNKSSDAALPVLALVLSLRQRTRPGPALDVAVARHLLYLLGPADYHRGGDETSSRQRMLSADSAPSALAESCASAKETLTEAGWFAERLDSELVALGVHAMPDETSTYRREHALCLHVGQLLKPAHALASARPSAGTQRALATLLTAIYTCITRLAKHFLARGGVDQRALAHAKFDVLVKLVGGAFSETVAGFISSVQNVGANTKSGKSQADSLLPGLTFNKETLERYLIRLSKTAKTDLMQFVKVNGARDFRLKKTLLVGDEGDDDPQPNNTSRADTSKADTSKANTSKANTSKANTSNANTSKANTSKVNTSRANRMRLDSSQSDSDTETPPPKRTKKSR